MKTLDEIIESAPYSGTAWTRDALYYLKEYKTVRESLIENLKRNDDLRQMYLNAMAQWEDNPALTWEQLKEMEGEPVFMDEYDQIDRDKGWRRCKWMLVEFVNDEYFIGRDMSGEQYAFYKVDKNDYSWQAYRKKRYE